MPNVRQGEQPYKDEDLEVNDEVVNLSLQDIHNNDINISDTANIQHDEDRVIHSSIDEVEVGIQKFNSSGRCTFRSRKSPNYLKDYVCTHVDFTYTIKDIPRTYNGAINPDDSYEWKEAMECEMKSLIENDTFTTVHLPKDRKIVGGRWVYALKTDPLGNNVHKARYVAKGYSQEHGSDYFNTFSPTAKITSIRIMMQVAAEYDLTVHQLDVRTAYLNAKIDCEIYIQQPKGYEIFGKNNEILVWRLNNSLYG